MIFDFSEYRLRKGCYSERPMTILNPEPRALLSAITEIALIETGNRSAREHWQQFQLRTLVNHVTQRSAFWRSRIGSRKASDIDLASLPRLTRHDVRTQVASEGSLLRAADGLSIVSHNTSAPRECQSIFLLPVSMEITIWSGALLNISWRVGICRSIERGFGLLMLP